MHYNMCNTKQQKLHICNYSLYNVFKHEVCIIKSGIMIYVVISQYAEL